MSSSCSQIQVWGSGGGGGLHCFRQGREFAGQFQKPLFQAENIPYFKLKISQFRLKIPYILVS
jgi:hypothetical protein